MKRSLPLFIAFLILSPYATFAATIFLTASSDSQTTFRTNSNANATNLNNSLLATTSPWTTGFLTYVINGNTLGSVSTTTASCTGSASCSDFTVIGNAPVTISATDTAFSTTSAQYFVSVTNLFSTTSTNFFVHSSTTIPKTYTANTFTALQTFANASTTLFSTAYASSTIWRGGGLTADCDNVLTSKLLWDTTTGQFSCGTDQTGGGGSSSIATSTSETSGRIPVWSSTSATPATLSGGTTALTFATPTTTASNLSVTTAASILGEYFTNFTTYVRSLFTGGRSITVSSGQFDADTELYTYGIAADMFATTTSGISTTTEDFLSIRVPVASTITGFTCYAKDTGTSTIRATVASNPLSAGTDILYSTGINCGAQVNTSTSTFSTTAVSAGSYIRIYVSAAGTRPRVIYPNFTLTKDD